MKFKKEIFQILAAIVLVAALFTSFSWICIHYQNPAESVKETLGIAVSFMGVLATIVAALIAVLLFNDWREQHKASFYVVECQKILNEYKAFINISQKLKKNENDFKKIIYPYPNSNKILVASFMNSEEKEAIRNITDEAIRLRNEMYQIFENLNNLVQVLDLLLQDKQLTSATDIFLKSTARNFLPLFDFKKVKNQPYQMLKTLQIVNPKLSEVIESSKGFISEIKKIGNI
ncbi:hypothetical protein [Acinetobacter bereziniae]|uniref:hypothetical protein n=1 Tax=Acinetobacter bereziniae TaxID=106648 RepID=UPI003AF54582